MRLESVLSVTGGTLLNTPSIAGFDSVALHPKRVTRGALFIAKNENDIPAAIEAGAYGIVTDLPVVPTDPEIAWIRVSALSPALVKLLRLWLIENPRTIRFVPRPVMEFLRQISYDRRILILEEEDEKRGETLLCSDTHHTILCDDATFIERIGYEAERVQPAPVEREVVQAKIFETSLIVDGRYHHQIPLVPCLVERLVEAIGTLKALSGFYSLQHLDYTPSFEPVFVDAAGHQVPFGASEHVLIFSDAETLCACHRTLEEAGWIERRIFFPTQIKFRCDIKLPMYPYDSLKRLLSIIRDDLSKQAYMVILGTERDRLLQRLERSARSSDTLIKGLF